MLLVPVMAQVRDTQAPPSGVIGIFEEAYHEATSLSWKARPSGGFVAYFEWNGMKTEAHYDAEGKWMYTDNFISREQLPQTAQVHFRRITGDLNPSAFGHRDISGGGYFFARIISNGSITKEWRYDRVGTYLGQF